MKKLLAGILLIAGSVFSAQTVELSGDKDYKPYSYLDGTEAKGVYVDVLKAAFDKMPDYDVKFNMVAWKRAIALVKQGKTVGFFPPYYSKSRLPWTKFSEPILPETTIVFAKENTLAGKTKFPEDFYGKKVCLNKGFSPATMGGETFDKAVKSGKIKLIEGNNNKACLGQVNRGIADFYLNDQLVDPIFPAVKKGIKIKENQGYVGFTLKNDNYAFSADFQGKFNAVIKSMKENGEIDKILKKYK